MNEQKMYQRHQGWIFWLTGSWLIATFEHNYFTLSNYSLGKIWTIFGTAFPISDISAFLMVLALDLSLFWSISFIPAARRWDVRMIGVYIVLFVSTIISIILNVKYMIQASPSPGIGDILIGAVIGALIPVFVILFGYIEGHVVDSQYKKGTDNILNHKVKNEEGDGNDKKVTSQQVFEAMKQNPRLTRRQLANMFNVSPTTIQNRINEIDRREYNV